MIWLHKNKAYLAVEKGGHCFQLRIKKWVVDAKTNKKTQKFILYCYPSTLEDGVKSYLDYVVKKCSENKEHTWETIRIEIEKVLKEIKEVNSQCKLVINTD